MRAAFDALYPSTEYGVRVQASRKDGYWPYISRKEEPPLENTYGEFPLELFSELVDRAAHHSDAVGGTDRSRATFCDLGSGAGRLALYAATTAAWERCRGVELLTSLHDTAEAKLEQAAREGLLLCPCAFENLSWDDEALDLSGVDVLFAYSTAFPADEEDVLQELTGVLRPRLREGAVVVTTEYMLGDGFALLDSIEGVNPGVGDRHNEGRSIGYVHEKVCPLGSTPALGGELAAVSPGTADWMRDFQRQWDAALADAGHDPGADSEM